MSRRPRPSTGTRPGGTTVAALAVSVLLLGAGCASGDDSSTTAPTSPGLTSSAAAASPSESASKVKGTEIVVSVVKGKVQPPTHRVKVSKDTHIRLLVTSDEADEVHVHGYDVEKELPANTQATIEFVADQVGLFEVETHESGLQLLQLEVR
jgi:cupredoxin-like protein